jgi:hypothetical protein
MRTPLVCPDCGTPISVDLEREGIQVEYDIDEWTRRCAHPDAGGPQRCTEDYGFCWSKSAEPVMAGSSSFAPQQDLRESAIPSFRDLCRKPLLRANRCEGRHRG